MRLLFDHNLSPKLVRRLADLYPDSVHVSHLGLDTLRSYGYTASTNETLHSDRSP